LRGAIPFDDIFKKFFAIAKSRTSFQDKVFLMGEYSKSIKAVWQKVLVCGNQGMTVLNQNRAGIAR